MIQGPTGWNDANASFPAICDQSNLRNIRYAGGGTAAVCNAAAELTGDMEPAPTHKTYFTRAEVARLFEVAPNTVGRYRNTDPVLINYLIRLAVEKRKEEYLSFPQRALFDRIGIRTMVIETDPFGTRRHSAALGVPVRTMHSEVTDPRLTLMVPKFFPTTL